MPEPAAPAVLPAVLEQPGAPASANAKIVPEIKTLDCFMRELSVIGLDGVDGAKVVHRTNRNA
jgi:hypothetical protein